MECTYTMCMFNGSILYIFSLLSQGWCAAIHLRQEGPGATEGGGRGLHWSEGGGRGLYWSEGEGRRLHWSEGGGRRLR